MVKKRLRSLFYRASFLIEQYAFPFIIACFILGKSIGVAQFFEKSVACLQRVLSHAENANDQIILSRFMSEALVIVYNVVALWALIIRKKPIQKSDTVPEVIVPLLSLATFFSINLLNRIPDSLNPLLIPQESALTLSLAGSFVIFLGLFISTIAIFQLRHSFAVTIQVRDIVFHGFYRYIRHPVYFGYFIQMAGFLLVLPYLWTIFWAAASAILFIARAGLEEKKIAAIFPEYRNYMKHTPFIIPGIK